MKFEDDFDIVDGKVVGKKANEYAIHDVYVKCRRCEIRRPADKLRLILEKPVCIEHESNGLKYANVQQVPVAPVEVHLQARQQNSGSFNNSIDAPACASCGDITVRSGSCYKCFNCGSTTGCS